MKMLSVTHILPNSRSISVLAIVIYLLIAADQATAGDDFFLPTELSGGHSASFPVSGTLSNEQLIIYAAAIRDQHLSATQRALNHQWLSQYQNDDRIDGSRAFSRLFQRGFKEYWDKKRKEDFADLNYVPDSNGKGSVSEMNYDIRLSSDKINFGLTYDF